MRPPRQQILQGLFHDDIGVRQYCLDYFTYALQVDEAVMPLVTEVVDLHGIDAFSFLHSIRDLPQTDSTIEWMIKSFRNEPRLPDAGTTLDWRIDVLTRCESSLLDRHQADILAVLPPRLHTIIHRRLSYASLPAEDLWNQLQELCKRQMLLEVQEPYPQQHADDLVLTLAERRFPPLEQLVPLFQEEIRNDEDSLVAWLAPHFIEITGRARYHSALPYLVDKFSINSDYIRIQSQYALIRLGTDDVVRAVAAVLPQKDSGWHTYAVEIFKNIHSDESIHQATELLRNEAMPEYVHQVVAHGLASHGSTEALETIGEYLDSHENWLGDYEWLNTFEVMEAACKLLNFTLPQFDTWQVVMEAEIDSGMPLRDQWTFADDEAEDDSDFDDDDFDFPPSGAIVYDAPRVGRNDPCPCGSGKKFKKCCIGKDLER